MILWYILSIAFSFSFGIYFFKKVKMLYVKKSNKEIKELMELTGKKEYQLTYDDIYNLLPYGLNIWKLLLIIFISLFPIVNSIYLIIYMFVVKDKEGLTLEQMFGNNFIINYLLSYLLKIKNFLNKEL